MTILPTRLFGQTDIALSVAGLGTVKMGRNQGVKYPSAFELPEKRDIITLLEQAQNFGINWLDTAPAYGISEERLGNIIYRPDWIIATKTGEAFVNGQSHFNFSSEHTIASIERSLKHFNTDYLDIVMIHSDGNDLEIIHQTDCIDALQRAKSAGKIRAIGMSCKTVNGAIAALPYVDGLMLTLNLEYTNDLPAIDAAHCANKAVIIKKAFGSGHLTQKYSIDKLVDYVFRSPITAVITGTLNPIHLKENCLAIAKAAHAHSL